MTMKEVRDDVPDMTALAGAAKGGYALIAAATNFSGHRVQLKVGTLYAALDRLASEGLIAEAGDEIADGRVRRYYDLTEAGALLLADAAERTSRIASEASAASEDEPRCVQRDSVGRRE